MDGARRDTALGSFEHREGATVRRGRRRPTFDTVGPMCAACVAEGVTYVGGSVGILRVMAYRATRRRVRESTLVREGDGRPTATQAAESLSVT